MIKFLKTSLLLNIKSLHKRQTQREIHFKKKKTNEHIKCSNQYEFKEVEF